MKNRAWFIILLVIIVIVIIPDANDEQNEPAQKQVIDNRPKATLSIKPYNKDDRGKFWEICISYSPGSWDKPIALFEIKDVGGKLGNYSVSFIHLKSRCSIKNILVSFTDRHTPHEEWQWLKDLEPDSIEYVRVSVKANYEDEELEIDELIQGDQIGQLNRTK